MKKILILLPLISICFLCSFSDKTSNNENNSLHNYEFDAYIDEIYDTLETIVGTERTELFSGGVGNALGSFLTSLKQTVFSNASIILIAVAMLISVASVTCGTENESLISSAVVAVLSIPAVRELSLAFTVAKEGISSGSELFSELIPTVTAAVALGGGAGASSVAATSLGITLSLVSHFISGGMLIAAELIFAFAMMGSIDSLGLGSGFAKGIRNIFTLIAGAVSVLTLGSLSVSTVLSAVGDSLSMRAAKYAASSAIPIVGGTVSGALGALVSGVRSLSIAVGVFGTAALASAFALPVVTLIGYKLSLGACSMICVFTGAMHGQRLFSALSLATDAMIAALAISATLYILELSVLMSVVKGVL